MRANAPATPAGSPSVSATRRISPRCASAAASSGPELPHRVAQLVLAFERFGMLGGAIAAGAIRHGDRSGAGRRARRAQLQGARPALERAGQRVARARARAGRRGGDPRAQPPRLPRRRVRRRQVRRPDHPAEHIVRRPPDPRGGRPRGHRSARLRRRVLGDAGRHRAAAWALARLDRRGRRRARTRSRR